MVLINTKVRLDEHTETIQNAVLVVKHEESNVISLNARTELIANHYYLSFLMKRKFMNLT